MVHHHTVWYCQNSLAYDHTDGDVMAFHRWSSSTTPGVRGNHGRDVVVSLISTCLLDKLALEVIGSVPVRISAGYAPVAESAV